jgi:tetratricopeptide (TPR) repeat protein
VERHLDRGDKFLKEQKYAAAADEYRKAGRLNPDNEHVIRGLGLAYLKLGLLDKAFPFLSKIEAMQPDALDVRIGLGLLYLGRQQPQAAIREAQAVLQRDRKNRDAYELLGAANVAANDQLQAVDAYRHLLELSPENPEAHYRLGLSLLAAHQESEARREFENTLRLAPDNSDALSRLVALDEADGRLDDALARVQKQLATAGRHAQTVMLLAAVNIARGDQQGAEAAYREAMRLDPGRSEAGVALAGLYQRSGKHDQAIELLDSALATQKSPTGYSLRGVILQSKGDFQGARRAYEQALAIDPHFSVAANNLAWLLSEKFGDIRKAFTLAADASRASPDDPRVADTFGWIVYKTLDYTRAAALLKQSAEKLPNDAEVQYHYGMAALKSGAPDDARRALTRAVNSPADFAGKESARKALAALP